ncbi:Adenylate cyclase [Desulfovibrio sp. DV]|uniref:CHASE2 domain-containing protein n=1 Tax=Desulfovibrio sp. DV TaxID=1844708 RepID=UPI00094B9352|nr:adenylate/guanylate cyclase domain-containing protein [Desulfovibrio sp. DV]OLN28923.1 Adenylate cyclase [Desulfovibrio sp. DV]
MEQDAPRESRRRSALLGLAAGAGLWCLMALAGATSLGRGLETMAQDALQPYRDTWTNPPAMLVVAVDEASFQEIGLPWPWPRALHARLLNALAKAGARLVVCDIVFAEPSTPEQDDALAQALAHGPPTILAQAVETVDDAAFVRRIRIDPLPLFAAHAAGVGLAVLTPDPDGTVRRFAAEYGGLPTLAAVAARTLTGRALPPDSAGLIDFPGPARTIDTVSYAQVIDPDHPLPAARIRDRIVLVGRSMAASGAPLGQADSFSTPRTRTTGLAMAGPEIHAAILGTLLAGSAGHEVPRGVSLALAGLLLPLVGALCFGLRPLAAAGVAVGAALTFFGAAAALFLWRFVWLPPALDSLGLLGVGAAGALYRAVVESKQRRFLTRAFARYVSPEVVRAVVAHPERLELGGEEAEVTVLFSDLAGFTTFSEKLSPKELIAILNACFTPATAIVLASGGTLDKFIGDAVMAFWGAPLPASDHAARALGAALAMREAVNALSRDFAARGLPHLAARMGLATGAAVVGNVGSRERFDYTILGDTVNLASRLESLNKYYGTDILLSEPARTAAGEGFPCRAVDTVRVKGRAAAVTVYEPLGRAGDRLPDFATAYASARELYRRQEFSRALEGFLVADAARGNDPPSRVMAERCRVWIKTPPPPDWDGVFAPEGK